MTEKNFIKKMKRAKILQFVFIVAVDIAFVAILLSNPNFSKRVFDDPELFIVCAVTWLLIILSLLCMLHDFVSLRSFARESHALNQLAYLDSLTGIPNRHGLDVIFRTYDTPESMADIGCYMATISNLKEINDALGREAGDKIIRDFCNIFESVGDHFGIVGRNGGNEFLAVINSCTEKTMQQFTEQLNQELAKYNNEQSEIMIQIADAYILNTDRQINAFPEILIVTYNKLHSVM